MRKSKSIRVLIVEPDDAAFARLRELLADEDRRSFVVARAATVEKALARLVEEHYDLCLVADRLNDSSGLDLLRRGAKQNANLPFVLLLDSEDETSDYEALRLGASDCLVKDEVTPRLMRRAIRYAIERKRVTVQILDRVFHDGLTGLPNRRLFMESLAAIHARKQRSRGCFGLLFLDLDHFNRVNDTLGHSVGDHLLTQIADRLRHVVRQSDVLCRMGGDEFAVILDGLKRPEQAAVAAERFIEALASPFAVEGHDVFVTCSIGICTYPQGGAKPDALVNHADMAMYRAKDSGQNNYVIHTPEMMNRAVQRLQVERTLRRALEDDSFVLHYQPQIRLADGAVIGTEALVRMIDPDQGIIPPNSFIPVAEETGLITDLGLWVLRTACEQNAAWRERGLGNLRVAVNLSARQFQQGALAHSVKVVLAACGLPPELLELELTEGQLAEDVEQSIRSLTAIRDMGVRIAIDDFGTGYSSLAYLKRFPVHTLKIDRSFVNDVIADPDDAAIASAIIDLSRHLGLDVVAEGVENLAQRNFLERKNCDAIQGYLISKPLPAEAFEAWLRDYRPADLAKAV